MSKTNEIDTNTANALYILRGLALEIGSIPHHHVVNAASCGDSDALELLGDVVSNMQESELWPYRQRTTYTRNEIAEMLRSVSTTWPGGATARTLTI